MTILSGYRDTRRMGDDVIPGILDLLVADNVHIFKGAIVGLAGGYAAPAGSACTKVVGIAESEADNTQPGHAIGAKRVRVRQGTFKVANSAPRTRWRSPTSATSATPPTTRRSRRPRAQNLPVAGTVIGVEPDGVRSR